MVLGDAASTGLADTFEFAELGLQSMVRDVPAFTIVAGQVMTSGFGSALTPPPARRSAFVCVWIARPPDAIDQRGARPLRDRGDGAPGARWCVRHADGSFSQPVLDFSSRFIEVSPIGQNRPRRMKAGVEVLRYGAAWIR